MTIEETGVAAVPVVDDVPNTRDSTSLIVRARQTLKTIFYNRRWIEFPRDANYSNSPLVTAVGFAVFVVVVIANMSVARKSLLLRHPSRETMADFFFPGCFNSYAFVQMGMGQS
jgi:hypothetical protein